MPRRFASSHDAAPRFAIDVGAAFVQSAVRIARHRLRITERTEKRVDARGGDTREKIAQVHPQDDFAAYVRLDVGEARPALAESMGSAMHRHGIEDAAKDPALDLAEADFRHLHKPHAVALRHPHVPVMTQRSLGCVHATHIGEPIQFAHAYTEPRGEIAGCRQVGKRARRERATAWRHARGIQHVMRDARRAGGLPGVPIPAIVADPLGEPRAIALLERRAEGAEHAVAQRCEPPMLSAEQPRGALDESFHLARTGKHRIR